MDNSDAFIRAKEALARKGVTRQSTPASGDLPAGQRLVSKMVAMSPIVRDLEETPRDTWKLRVYGEVANEVTLNWEALTKLGVEERVFDIHCVTSWSRLGQQFS